MKLEEAIPIITAHLEEMASLYGRPVFDEWAVISILNHNAKLLEYSGPRRDEFRRNFLIDLEGLESALFSTPHDFGDFEFATFASGTRFDAFMVLGVGLYLICNNCGQSMYQIIQNSQWVKAQVPFARLSETFRSDPLVVAM